MATDPDNNGYDRKYGISFDPQDFSYAKFPKPAVRRGDIASGKDWDGKHFTVWIENWEPDVKNGRPGWTGLGVKRDTIGKPWYHDPDGDRWGYDNQISQIIAHNVSEPLNKAAAQSNEDDNKRKIVNDFKMVPVNSPRVDTAVQKIFVDTMKLYVYYIQFAQYLTSSGKFSSKEAREIAGNRFGAADHLNSKIRGIYPSMSESQVSQMAINAKNSGSINYPTRVKPEPSSVPMKPTETGRPTTTVKPTKMPAPGFKEENRLGWSRQNFEQFFFRVKPGSPWTDLKKWITKGNVWRESTNGGQNQCDILIELFRNQAPYPGLVTLFEQLKNQLQQRNLKNCQVLISRIEPRIVRLWNFGRSQALAKSIVIKSMNKRLI